MIRIMFNGGLEVEVFVEGGRVAGVAAEGVMVSRCTVLLRLGVGSGVEEGISSGVGSKLGGVCGCGEAEGIGN